MARPREFSKDEALEKAMQEFWAKGYRATSLSDLTRAMGLSKSSFYDAFGSKRALFLSAIDHYNHTVGAAGTAALIAEAGGGRAGIAAVFEHHLADMVDAGERRGCFVNNSAIEMAPSDDQAAALVSAGLANLEEAFHGAVTEGQARGEIASEREPRALARYLASSLNGLVVLAKARPERTALDEVVSLVLETLG